MNEKTRNRLAGVLGPAAAEVSCEVCFDELDRFVELELAGEDAEAAVPGMTAHLEGCPACAEDHAALRALLVASEG
jgi:anti-sigma factor RsiW